MATVSGSCEDWMGSVELSEIVRRVARSLRLNSEETEDVEQEVLIALWQRNPHDDVSPAWVVVVAYNKSVDLQRRRARWRVQDRTLGSLLRQVVATPELELLVRAEAARLPADERRFFALRYGLGMTEKEVGASLGLCRASVRWKDRNCLRTLGA